jgi:hypothetical protein
MAETLTCCYHYNMMRKPLIKTNPHLRVPAKYRKALITNVSSSTAVETGASVKSVERTLTRNGNTGQFKK